MRRDLFLIIVLGTVIFMANIWGSSIYILDEAKNATCAKEMFHRGDWVVPTFNGRLRTDKPPLHYYFMMLGYSLFGVNPFAARFFSSLCGLLTVLSTYVFAARYLGRKAGFFSAVVLLAALQVGLQFKLAVPDPYLIFLFTLALFFFFSAYHDNKPARYYLFYAALALAFLAKGPIALALPGLIVLLFLIWSSGGWPGWKKIWSVRPVSGLLLFTAIALPWYWAVGAATEGEWLKAFFLHHNIGRYTETMEGHGGFFLQVPLLVIAGLLPFSLFILQSCRYAWRQRENDALKLCMIAAAVVIVFFSFSKTKLPSYPAPSFAFVAVLIGYFLSGTLTDRALLGKGRVFLAVAIGTGLLMALPLGLYIGIGQDSSLAHLSWVAWWFSVLPLSGILALVLLKKQKLQEAYLSLAGGFVVMMLIFNFSLFPYFDRENPVTKAREIVERSPRKIAYFGRMNPAFVFYSAQPIPRLMDLPEVEALLGEKVYIISSKGHLKELQGLIDEGRLQVLMEQKDLFERPVTVLLSN